MRSIGTAALMAGVGLAAFGVAGPALATDTTAPRGTVTRDHSGDHCHWHHHHWWCPKDGVSTGGGGTQPGSASSLMAAAGLGTVALGGGLAIAARRRRGAEA
jgi:hypothetical protein